MKRKIKVMQIVRVDKYEFETADGQVFEHPIELDEVPTLEEFQKIHNSCHQHLTDLLSEGDNERDGDDK
jgi:hypothetical protein